MIKAFCSNTWLDAGKPLAGLAGSAVINHLLQTAACRFPCRKKDTISALLEQGCSPIVYDQFGNHALHILAGSSDPDASTILKLFLSWEEAASKNIRAACLLHLNSRNWLKASGDFGNTPLTLVVLSNNVECVRLLLAIGADPTCTGEFDRTLLELAVVRGHDEVVCALLEYSYF